MGFGEGISGWVVVVGVGVNVESLSVSILLELPISVVQGAHLASLEPPGNAMEMEGVITHAPSHSALFTRSRGLIGLTLDAEIHDVIPTDGAVVHHDIPGPQGHGIPFFHLESAIRNKVPLVNLLRTKKRQKSTSVS